MKIKKQIDDETKEVYQFYTYNFNFVFVRYELLVKPKGKRDWTVKKYWDKFGNEGSKTCEEPELPEIIKSEALSEAMKLIRVLTWDEWKAL